LEIKVIINIHYIRLLKFLSAGYMIVFLVEYIIFVSEES